MRKSARSPFLGAGPRPSLRAAILAIGAAASGAGALALVLPRPALAETHAAATPTGSSSATVRVPAGSPGTMRLLMDALATRVALGLGYERVDAAERDELEDPGARAIAGGPGFRMASSGAAIDDVRAFLHAGAPPRLLEIGHSRHPAGGYEIHVHGSAGDQSARQPNPDVAAVEREALSLVATLPAAVDGAPPPLRAEDFDIEVRTLGYAQADSVMGLLKALGYDTVEYQATEGDNIYDKLYQPFRTGSWRLPVVVKLLEGNKTSIMDPAPVTDSQAQLQLQLQMQMQYRQQPGVPDMGGTYLHDVTTGEPLQRLLILHDPDDPASLRRLRSLLDGQVDVAARQIVIEAMVLEINRDKISDLGLTFGWIDNNLGATWERNALGQSTEFTFDYDRFRTNAADIFKVKLHAVLGSGDARILSNPSVLVLDGRQARIQVGQRVPVITSTATANVVQQHVEYETVGIVLNLRPRLNTDGTEVTMQVETIVSAVDPTGTTTTEDVSAPTFDNRLVQTYCRIADNTPFIVGGLISEDRRDQVRRVPGLGSIPFLGALFRRKTHQSDNKEVIIVLTPHVVPRDEKSFSRVIPEDSDTFDSFGKELFRNKYRIRRQDVFDLRSVTESEPLAAIRAGVEKALALDPSLHDDPEIANIQAGGIPGEDRLVRRMLWETIRRTGFAQHVDPGRIITFRNRSDGSRSLELARLVDLNASIPAGMNALALSFDAPGRAASDAGDASAPSFTAAEVSYVSVPAADYDSRLLSANSLSGDEPPRRAVMLLSRDHPGGADLLDFTRSVLVLKELLRLNPSLPLRISEFYVGREIVYPSADELRSNYHVVDADAAKLFFEVQQYYPAFQCAFNRGIRDARRTLDPGVDLGPAPTCIPQVPGPLVKVPAPATDGPAGVARRRTPGETEKRR